ncbi:MAG TPA: hypothetical protein VHZ76_06550 [Gammaproteobacteria bacterium]|nr:hypothetical protein [Gammaproteobacteria bacterium]
MRGQFSYKEKNRYAKPPVAEAKISTSIDLAGANNAIHLPVALPV